MDCWSERDNRTRVVERQRADLPAGDLAIQLPDGSYKRVERPALEMYDDEEMGWAVAQEIEVTEDGRRRAAALLAAEHELFTLLGGRVAHLVDVRYFDAAVREACVSLEHQLKTSLGSTSYGARLVEEWIAATRVPERLPEAWARIIRGRLRSVFTLIRNDVMHNLREIDETTSRALLARVALAQQAVVDLSGPA